MKDHIIEMQMKDLKIKPLQKENPKKIQAWAVFDAMPTHKMS